MSKRREVKERLATLDEINSIMKTMKNLALLEIRKLEMFLDTQRRVTASIEMTARDFLYFYPQIPAQPGHQQLLIIIGSERGFCGDYNESLVAFLNSQQLQRETLLVVVGRKLESKLLENFHIAAFIESHSVAEEVPITLQRLIEVLNRMQQAAPTKIGQISVLYYDDESEKIRLRQLLPLSLPEPELTYSHPPLLHLEPTQFLTKLTDQYLYVLLHEVFYSSFMRENHKRLAHMDSAIQHLEKDTAKLRMRANRLRQEEIINEIEIILLSTEVLSANDKSFHS
ncbi:F0F1 ATP synthase subunit gamma [Nitrosomonas communis]|uniref:F-type H+-transporting ATPase subunit gamma n=1 Tax=Nitrosomonas communis TaxID=44574 RepID=A0A1I4K432_9PROT|nr:FoF1 ATP synthase subunit gamma [Nitrosomonas communis]SFL73534.1 F-type H+-transporting ATPase subunit gamma [Nitrosomonas communis]